jgi:hypothetical protein
MLALLCAALPAFAAETAPAAAPKAVVSVPVHDFGSVPPVEVLQHTFEIRNEGAAPLEITKVETDCKCTATEFDHEVAPGAVGKVTAAVDTRVLNGAVEGVLSVHTNDPSNPVLQLRTKVIVGHILSAKPGYARWNTVQGEKEGVIGQTVWANDGAPFEVLRVEAPPGVKTSFRSANDTELRPDAKGSQWHVEASIDSKAPVGAITGFLEVVTTHPKQPNMRIPISGFVRPVMHSTPPTGELGAITPDGRKSARFFVQNFATEKIEITGADSTVKGAKLEVTPIEDGRSFNVDLILPASMPAGSFTGALRIRTDSAKVPVFEIPLSGTVTKAAPSGAAAG